MLSVEDVIYASLSHGNTLEPIEPKVLKTSDSTFDNCMQARDLMQH